MSYKKEIAWMLTNNEPSTIESLCSMRNTSKDDFDEFCLNLKDELDAVKLGELVEAACKSTDKKKFLKVLSNVSGEVQANIIFYGICKTQDEFSAFLDRNYNRLLKEKREKKQAGRSAAMT